LPARSLNEDNLAKIVKERRAASGRNRCNSEVGRCLLAKDSNPR